MVCGAATRPPANLSSAELQGLRDNPNEPIDVSSKDVALLRAATLAMASITDTMVESILVNNKLGPLKSLDEIRDRFSSVLGDGFHYMDRTVPPMHHDCKKAFFVALSVCLKHPPTCVNI